MTDFSYVLLPGRRLIAVTGAEARDFLQGLITNDMALVSEKRGIYAALLTPQGKYLHDFFVVGSNDGFYLDCEGNRIDDLLTRLKRYRMRAQVGIEDAEPALEVYALTGTGIVEHLKLPEDEGAVARFGGGLILSDPRASALGVRAYLPTDTGKTVLTEAGIREGTLAAYDRDRYLLSVANSAPEFDPEKSYPMEYGVDRLNGISFSKGCYVGQEVTVRMKNRDLTRKCLLPVKIDGPTPSIGATLDLNGANAGELRGSAGDTGLALVRKDLLDRAIAEEIPFKSDSTTLFPIKEGLKLQP